MDEIYRKEALDRFRSPADVEHALRILRRRDWIPPAGVAALIACAFVWSVLGRVPVSVQGQSILLTPTTVLPFQASSPGRIERWHVKVGDFVASGQILASLDQPETESQLAQARAKLVEQVARDDDIARLEGRSFELRRSDVGRRRAVLTRRVSILTSRLEESRLLTEQLRKKDTGYLGSQRESLGTTRETINALARQLDERVKSFERLREEGLSSIETLLAARRNSVDTKLQIAEIDLKLHELELAEIRSEKAYIESIADLADQENEITSLSLQLESLDTESAALEQEERAAGFDRSRDVSDLERTIEQFRGRLAESCEIKSSCDGVVLELTTPAGAMVAAGMRLGTIDARTERDEMVALAYFTMRDGKKIAAGMRVHVSPDTVQRERFGSIVGTVTSVSGYPVTAQGAANYVGNGDVARQLTEAGRQIEVFVSLERDPASASGYRWTSAHGPPISITAGTLASIRVVVEERRPISYLIPIVEDWSGL